MSRRSLLLVKRLPSLSIMALMAGTIAAAPTELLFAAGWDTPSASATPPPAPSLGDVVPSFRAEAIDGATRHVDYPKGSATVLLFFLSGCPTCHKMIPEWNRAYERRPKGVSVVGVLMDREPPGFFSAMPVAFPVVRSPGREFLQKMKIHRAPVTLRVGPGGKVEDVGIGIVDPIHLGELFRP